MSNLSELSNIVGLISSSKSLIVEKYHVQSIGVFGSYVRGENNKSSDLDILVSFSEPVGMFDFLNLEEHLSELTKKKVDLVSKKALKRYIGEQILKEVVYI